MSQTMTPEEVAEVLENEQARADGEVVYKENMSTGDRHEYSFFDCPVHAHRIPDNFTIVGFGKNWFALREQ